MDFQMLFGEKLKLIHLQFKFKGANKTEHHQTPPEVHRISEYNWWEEEKAKACLLVCPQALHPSWTHR